MVQLEDEVYAKLKKDADDNRQIVAIVRWVVIAIIFLSTFFFWGKQILDMDIRRRQMELECQLAITKAENNVEVRKIESEGMDLDDYILWLNAREKD